MPAQTPLEVEIDSLNREIEHLETEFSLLADLSKKRATAARRANWQHQYLRLARLIRKPTAKWDWWPLASLLVGPALFGAFIFVVVNLIGGSATLAMLAFLFSAASGAVLVASLLYRPTDALLLVAINEAEAHSQITKSHWKEAFERQAEVKQQLARLVEERRSRMATGRVQRAALLQRPWKTLSGVEWQDFVVEACRTLGAATERRGRNEIGEELVVELGGRRVAALVTASNEPNDSDAVYRAIGLMQREGCGSCAIISNGRFTGAAQDFAARNNCRLISREEFPDFVMGSIGL